MCGIVGIISKVRSSPGARLEQYRDRLKHRGPDDAGLWLSADGRVAFGHRRLAIIDLSPAGHQPMISKDGHCAIVFNGEVYNFKELRAELETLGHGFLSGSDTEVVLAAYQQWGDRCMERFNGMFAFAIYDAGKGQTAPSLFMARDRAGKKPFYYLHENSRFQFASELKAIDVATDIDLQALNYYLALGYVPGGLCLSSGVKKLPPAHAARLDLATFVLKTWRYWELPQNTAVGDEDGEVLADQADALLTDAVRLRLISDVPVGVLLSGGLDSSLIAAVAARQSVSPIKTFTVSQPGSRYDESAHARRIADFLSSEHHELKLERPSLSLLSDLAPFVDEPIADSSLIPSFMVSRLTREHVKVALGGDGGDELFGGYLDYPASIDDERRLGWLPGFALSAVGKLAAKLPAGVRGRNRLASLRGGPLRQMAWGTPYFDVELRRRLLGSDAVVALGNDLDAPERWLLSLLDEGLDPVDCMTRTHFGSILPDDFLVKVDRASMANSLEMRAPLLDYRLVEFAFSKIPSRWKVSGGESRRVQKILARRLLPPNMDIERKQGFSIPMDDWLRADRCELVRDHASTLPGVISRNELESLIEGEMKGRANGARLFALLMLGIASTNNGWC